MPNVSLVFQMYGIQARVAVGELGVAAREFGWLSKKLASAVIRTDLKDGQPHANTSVSQGRRAFVVIGRKPLGISVLTQL